MKLTQPSLSSPSTPVVSALALAASSELGLVRSGLVAEYRFNEGSGQILYDYSGNNNHGTLGSTTGADTNDPTYTGTGASFTTDDYINCGMGIEGANNKSPMTLMVAYAHSAKPTGYETIAGKVSLNANEWGLRTVADNTSPVFSVRGDGAATLANGSVLTVGVYSCITGTFDGTYPRIYNGSTLTHTGNALAPQELDTSSKVFYIGCRNAPSYYFNGNVAYVAVWNRALTKEEISQNYAYLKSYLLRERGIQLS